MTCLPHSHLYSAAVGVEADCSLSLGVLAGGVVAVSVATGGFVAVDTTAYAENARCSDCFRGGG